LKADSDEKLTVDGKLSYILTTRWLKS